MESSCTTTFVSTCHAEPAFANVAFVSSESAPFGIRRSAALAAYGENCASGSRSSLKASVPFAPGSARRRSKGARSGAMPRTRRLCTVRSGSFTPATSSERSRTRPWYGSAPERSTNSAPPPRTSMRSTVMRGG
jgi:hypothetical protein